VSTFSRLTFYSMAKKPAPKDPFQNLDLAPYAGRWVAIVRGRITGVGMSEQQARLASKHQRPKEEPQIVFVPEEQTKDERPKTKE
jgi:hypothetical protein